MKVTHDLYIIKKELIKKRQKFTSISDLHYGNLEQLLYKETMKKFLEYVSDNSKDSNAILLPGDLTFWLTSFQDKKFLTSLINDLKDLSFRLGIPIFISCGNHDLPLRTITEEEKNYWNIKTYLDDRNNGIYLLDNEQVRYENIVVTGFSPDRSAYGINNDKNRLTSVHDLFESCAFTFNKEDINILLTHYINFFTKNDINRLYGELFERLTFGVTGHIHDGYIPIWLQKILGSKLKDKGLTEYPPFIIDMCRGAFKISKEKVSDVILPNEFYYKDVTLNTDESLFVVNRGVAKYSWFLPSRPSMTTIILESMDSKETLKLKK